MTTKQAKRWKKTNKKRLRTETVSERQMEKHGGVALFRYFRLKQDDHLSADSFYNRTHINMQKQKCSYTVLHSFIYE